MDRRDRLDVCHEIAHTNAKGFGNSYQSVQRDVGFAPLNLANVIGMEVCKFGQLFMRQARGFSVESDCIPQRLAVFWSCRHNTISKPANTSP